jgi:hypothetical protein
MASFFNQSVKKDPYGTLNPEQVAVNKQLGPYFSQTLSDDPLQFGKTSSDYVAPIGVDEQDIINRSNRLSALGSQGLEGLMSYDPQTFNTQFEEEVAQPTYSSFTRNVLPTLQESLPTFHTAQGVQTNRAFQDVTDKLLTARNTARENALNRQLSAITSAPTTMSGFQQVASVPRIIQQAGLDKQYTDWARGQESKQNSIQRMLDFLGVSTGTITTKNSAIDNINQVLGTLGNVTGIVGNLFKGQNR